MDCIPENKSLVMKLTQNNQQKVKSPKINHKITINTLNIYNYIYNSLLAKKYNEPYKILVQLKTIIRCVWRTYYTKSEYPDIKYLHSISNYNKGESKQPSYPCKLLEITPETRELDSYTLVILQRNLIPDFNYDIESFSCNLWDKYLLILDNILLSEAIEHRKLLKQERDKQLSSLPKDNKEYYNEQYNLIMSIYSNDIENLKQKYIFKIINFLNYLYYNDENKSLAWATVLLRLSVITHNKFHNEQLKHDKKEFETYIKNYKYNNDYELLQLYVAIIVYSYEFIHNSIIKYDKQYIETMVYYLSDNLLSYDDYINNLYNDIITNINILKVLVNEDELLTYIIKHHLNKYTYKIKQIEEIVVNNFDKDVIDKYNIINIINNLIAESDITKLFNKMTQQTYNKISADLNGYTKEQLLSSFIKTSFNNYGSYTKYIINYLLTRFDKNELNNIIINELRNIKHNLSTSSFIGLLMVIFNDITYYNLSKDSISSLVEANKHSPTNYIKDFILTVSKQLIESSTGYDKYQLSEIIDNLSN